MKEDCIFCKIANGMIPAVTIYENSDYKVILDVSPASKGHTLILPKEHFDDIFDMDSDTAAKLFGLAAAVARALKDATGCEGMNIVQNNGEIAGQTVFHFHMHLVPRYADDQVEITWKPQEISQDELKTIASAIKKAL